MKQTSLIDSVEKRISDMIFVTNEFRPQDKLPNERTLAEQFSVSRNTIRESIKSLEAKGVLTVKHGSGTYVRRLPGLRDDPFGFMEMEDKYQLMKDLYEVRSILEPEAAAIVTERATDEEIKKILYYEQLCNDMMVAGKDWMLADQEFHAAIAQATHNEAIKRFIPSIHQSAFLGWKVVDSFLNVCNAKEHHRRIAEFIGYRDPMGARLAARAHMIISIQNVETFRKNNLEIFKKK